LGAFGKNSSAKTLIILKNICFIIILDKNKPILIIGSLFLDQKDPNMVFGKIFSKIFHISSIYGIINLNFFLASFELVFGYVFYYFFIPAF
jgi:hypothetical protein